MVYALLTFLSSLYTTLVWTFWILVVPNAVPSLWNALTSPINTFIKVHCSSAFVIQVFFFPHLPDTHLGQGFIWLCFVLFLLTRHSNSVLF